MFADTADDEAIKSCSRPASSRASRRLTGRGRAVREALWNALGIWAQHVERLGSVNSDSGKRMVLRADVAGAVDPDPTSARRRSAALQVVVAAANSITP
jgi:hypothetical protein